MQSEMSDKKIEILEIYKQLVSKLHRTPSLNEMVDEGVTRDMIKHHFMSLSRLEEIAREDSPEMFFDIHVEQILTDEYKENLRDTISSVKRFIITTAVTGSHVHEGFVASMNNYAARRDAVLLALVVSDPAHNCSNAGIGSIDRRIIDNMLVVVEDTNLNDNLFISTIKLSAKHMDPVTSLTRIGQRHGSFIYASPKQRLKVTPVSNAAIPRITMTTGACTVPEYTTLNYMSERTAYIANHDHVIGGIVVEVVNSEVYHYRQIQCAEDGSFVDLGVRYHPDGTTSVDVPAIVLGDWHSGSTNPQAMSAFIGLVERLKIKHVILHDLFDGKSINHHEAEKSITRAQTAESGSLSLPIELMGVAEDLDIWLSFADQVTVVKSNHDEFLDRYLQEAMYVKDPLNYRLALELAIALHDRLDPLQVGVERYMTGDTSRVRWLSRDDDLKIHKIQVAAHGDKGLNGARGSIRGMEQAYGSSITAHSHTPEILRGAWVVGTLSNLKLNYNVGPSSWLHTSCLVYSDGSRQLINAIDGQYELED